MKSENFETVLERYSGTSALDPLEQADDSVIRSINEALWAARKRFWNLWMR